jgi:hypothetical protein
VSKAKLNKLYAVGLRSRKGEPRRYFRYDYLSDAISFTEDANMASWEPERRATAECVRYWRKRAQLDLVLVEC